MTLVSTHAIIWQIISIRLTAKFWHFLERCVDMLVTVHLNIIHRKSTGGLYWQARPFVKHHIITGNEILTAKFANCAALVITMATKERY